MRRDIDFEVPNAEVAKKLIELCRAEGWTVDPVLDVFNYVQGVPFIYGYEGEDIDDLYVPERTHTSVIAHKPGFRDEEWDEINEKADFIAIQVGGVVTGSGTAFFEED